MPGSAHLPQQLLKVGGLYMPVIYGAQRILLLLMLRSNCRGYWDVTLMPCALCMGLAKTMYLICSPISGMAPKLAEYQTALQAKTVMAMAAVLILKPKRKATNGAGRNSGYHMRHGTYRQ